MNKLILITLIALSGCVATISTPVPAPPVAEVEVVGIAPYAEAVWIPGVWVWHPRHHRYDWDRGHWAGHYHH